MSDPLPYDQSQIGQLPDSGDPRERMNYFLRVIKGVLVDMVVSAIFTLIEVKGNVGDASGIVVTRATNDGVNTAFIRKRTSRGTNSVPTAVEEDDILGSDLFSGYDGSGYADGGQLLVRATEDWASGDHGTRMSLLVTPKGETSAVEGLMISPYGTVTRNMTTTERDAIISPIEGLWIYNETNHRYEFYNGTAWRYVSDAAA